MFLPSQPQLMSLAVAELIIISVGNKGALYLLSVYGDYAPWCCLNAV